MAGRPQYLVEIMAAQTFDLNRALESWRQGLAAQPQLSADDRRELERHLADSMADLQGRGLSQEESFWLAQRRIGRPQQLAEEFEKVDIAKVWRERLFWIWFAFFSWQIFIELIGSLTIATIRSRPPFHAEQFAVLAALSEFLSLLAPVVLVVMLAKGKLISQCSRLFQLIQNRRRLAIATLITILLSLAIRSVAAAHFYSHQRVWLENLLVPGIRTISMGLILIWLMPPQDKEKAA